MDWTTRVAATERSSLLRSRPGTSNLRSRIVAACASRSTRPFKRCREELDTIKGKRTPVPHTPLLAKERRSRCDARRTRIRPRRIAHLRSRRNPQCAPSRGTNRPGLGLAFRRQDHRSEWDRVGETNWRVEEGAIVADKLTSEAPRISSPRTSTRTSRCTSSSGASDNANSGIYLRCQDPANITPGPAMRSNIFDSAPGPDIRHRRDRRFRRGESHAQGRVASGTPTKSPSRGGRSPWCSTGRRRRSSTTACLRKGRSRCNTATGVIKFRKVAVKPL